MTQIASGLKTATGNSGKQPAPLLNVEGRNQSASRLCLIVNTTAVTGTTPSMALTVEWSADGTNFVPPDPTETFTAITSTANGKVTKAFAIKAPYYRVVWTLSGTGPNFTFTIDDFAGA